VILRRLPARELDPSEYLDGANAAFGTLGGAAFGSWGDPALFAWAFRDDAEILLLDDARGRSLAGTGVTFRTLRNGKRAAIMTGSWTLPEARGQGAFSSLVRATREIAAERDGVMLGFVRGENPSARGLATAGAVMWPAFYCRSTAAPALPAVELEPLDPDPSLFSSSFVYTPDQWRAQFLGRPKARIECLGVGNEWAAIIESAVEFDRVHAVSDAAALPQLAARAHAAGRRLFWYTTRPPTMTCEWTDGFLASLPDVAIEWDLQNGDRM
jgi:GNAT superfamily N-acetyltransferase